MRFAAPLRVEITRHDATRNLAAKVIQQAADGPRAGRNILSRCSVRRIETARQRVCAKIGLDPASILFEVKAAPDWARPQRKDAHE